MIYAYIRISGDKQHVDRQRFLLQKHFEANYPGREEIVWVEETISSTVDWEKRQIAEIVNHIQRGDKFVTDEISRIGRNIYEIMTILGKLMQKKAEVFIIAQNYQFKDDIQSQALAWAFSIAAQIERDLISSRTKTALQEKKAQGVKLGRPVGSKSVNKKLAAKDDELRQMLKYGMSISLIAKTLEVSRTTLRKYINESIPEELRPDNKAPFPKK